MANRKVGRPSRYTKALGERIIQELEKGRSLVSICREEGFPHFATVWRWGEGITESIPEEFRKRFTQAKAVRLGYWSEERIEIADDSSNDYIEKTNAKGKSWTQFNSEAFQRSKLRIDVRSRMIEEARGSMPTESNVNVTVIDAPPNETREQWEKRVQTRSKKKAV